MLGVLNVRRVVAVVVVFYAAGMAMRPCGAQQEQATYPVRGVVLNQATHRPIARALVDAGGDAALTDNDGSFLLQLPPGNTMFSIRRPGYGSASRSIRNRVNVGANMPEISFALIPDATITGHVSLSNGDEAEGIRIAVCRRRFANGHEEWTPAGSATTNSEGVFRIGDLTAPGTYLLYSMSSQDRSSMRPERGSNQAARYGYPSVIYPGVSDAAGAGLLTLSPGQQAQADFVLTRQRFYPVTITVPNHPELRGIYMSIFDASGRALEFATQWDEQAGAERVYLPTGHYYAAYRGRGQSETYGRVDFTVGDGPVSGLSMTLFPLQAVPVHVRKVFTATSSSNQSTTSNEDAEAGLSLTLASADSFSGNSTGSNLHHVEGSADSGLFEFGNVTPGRYWLSPRPYQGYVSSITSGGVDLTREPLTIGAGNTTAPIEITLRNDSGSITGQLNQAASNGTGASNGGAEQLGEMKATYIYAIPLFPSVSQYAQTAIQQSLQFTLTNVAPGSYRVFALDDGIDMESLSPEERQKYMSQGETVMVEPNGTASVQLDVGNASEESMAE